MIRESERIDLINKFSQDFAHPDNIPEVMADILMQTKEVIDEHRRDIKLIKIYLGLIGGNHE